MELNEYKKMFDLETSYWWYVGRRSIIRNLISKYWKNRGRVVDIGCGTGVNFSMFGEFSDDVLGLDISEQALAYCKERGFDNFKVIEDASRTGLPDHSAKLVTMFDVMEHIEDEKAVLAEIRRVLTNDGMLILTVPAYQFLWSEHDVALHHKRRYTVQSLSRLLRDNGYSIEKISYAITFSFPIILAYRALKGLLNVFYKKTPKTSHVQLPKICNDFFISLLKVEGILIKNINFPFGTSVVVMGRKADL